MKQILILIAALAGSTAADAQDESPAKEESPHVAAGSVALMTDYLFRGISQTDNHPAVQGSLKQRGIAILGYWTPAIPAGVTGHFELT